MGVGCYHDVSFPLLARVSRCLGAPFLEADAGPCILSPALVAPSLDRRGVYFVAIMFPCFPHVVGGGYGWMGMRDEITPLFIIEIIS